MSLFDAVNTAVSGLNAQSTAFGNISEDVANNQTIGFKRVDTNFVDYLTTSTPTDNQPGSVVARPVYVNNIQGSVTQTDNPLGMAISGQGFFAVSKQNGKVNNTPTFDPTNLYTRSGDFALNSQGYMVNGAGQVLNGWSADGNGGINQNGALAPIQVNQSTYQPIKTSEVTLSANLPATPATGTATPTSPLASQITVYDAMGTAHAVTLNWSQDSSTTSNTWNVGISVAGSVVPAGTPSSDVGNATVTFGAAGDNNTTPPGAAGVPAGTIQLITPASTDPGTVGSPSPSSTGQPATFAFEADFGAGKQTITLNLGTYGGTSGVTQFAGTTYNQFGMTQDGVPPGSYSGVTTQPNGEVVINYSNGQTSTIAQIPIITFNNPNGLQSQNGQAFTATNDSGTAQTKIADSNGAGSLVVGSVEGSNVDIGTELSHLIIAQQSYSSNAKVVTTANQMLQATLQMIA